MRVLEAPPVFIELCDPTRTPLLMITISGRCKPRLSLINLVGYGLPADLILGRCMPTCPYPVQAQHWASPSWGYHLINPLYRTVGTQLSVHSTCHSHYHSSACGHTETQQAPRFIRTNLVSMIGRTHVDHEICPQQRPDVDDHLPHLDGLMAQ